MDFRQPARLSVRLIGYQSANDRWPTHPEYDIHQLSPYRMNLTGLSQQYNLYFVAYVDKIFVYQPRFPDQALSAKPNLVIDTPPSDADLDIFGVDPHKPHSINNLEVATFGTEEFVAVVRDDGDWDAYLTRHIYEAITARPQPSSYVPTAEIRPLFHYNVGHSAWGLAVHSQARMVAVSSNEHLVNIFRFALSGADPNLPVTDSLIYDTNNEPITGIGTDRNHNEWLQVSASHQNIPRVAFCNTGDDPSGRWLLAIDLNAEIHSFDLLERGQTATTCARIDLAPREVQDYRMFERVKPASKLGWGLAFLDRRSFHLIQRPDLADIGLDDIVLSCDRNSHEWDLSSTIDAFGRLDIELCRTDGLPSNKRTIITELLDDLSGLYKDKLKTLYNLGNADAHVWPDTRQVVEMVIRRFLWNLPFEYDARPNLEDYASGWLSHYRDHCARHSPCMERLSAIHRIAAYRDMSSTSLAEILLQRLSKDPHFRIDGVVKTEIESALDAVGLCASELAFHGTYGPGAAFCPGLACPILTMVGSSVALLQPSGNEIFDPTQIRPHLPIVHLNNAFDLSHYVQSEAEAYQYLSGEDRVCCQVELPCLGALIVGKQAGPVVVLSLIKECADLNIYDNDDRWKIGDSGAKDRMVYGMSMEHRLPRVADDENAIITDNVTLSRLLANRDPSVSKAQQLLYDIDSGVCHLIGLAVGPMQGTEGLPDDQKRWRLMIMYEDHSVWSYEISLLGGSPSGD